MAKRKFAQEEVSLADAVSVGYSALQELRDEVREIVDNAPEGLSETQRIQTLGETADALDSYCDDEPDVPDGLGDERGQVSQEIPARKGRGLSRASRRDNAVAYLTTAISLAEGVADRMGEDEDSEEEQELAEECREFISTIQDCVDAAEGCEFPGMYG